MEANMSMLINVKKLILLVAISMLSILALSAELTIYCEYFPPLQSQEKDGSLSGFVVEVVKEIQKRVGNTDKIQLVPWARGLNELDTKPNVVLFSMSRTGERNPLYQWIGPVKESSFIFYAKAGTDIKIKSLDDAKKLTKIGVYNKDVRDLYLTSQGFKNLERSPDNVASVKKLMAGRLDVVADSDDSIDNIVADAGFKKGDLVPLYTFMKSQLYIVMSKSTPSATVKQWNDALAGMKKDGSFAKLHKKFFPGAPLPGPAIEKF